MFWSADQQHLIEGARFRPEADIIVRSIGVKCDPQKP